MAAYGAVEPDYKNVDTGETRWSSSKKIKLIGIIAVVGVLVTVATVLVVVFTLRSSEENNNPNPPYPPVGTLEDAMAVEKIMAHLNSLQNIASVSGNTRAVGTLGYNNSVAYVVDELRLKTNYAVQVQTFGIPVYVEVERPFLSQASPEIKNYTENTDFDSLGGYAGRLTITNALVSVIANYGCDTEDFVGFVPQSIALIHRGGNCTSVQRVQLAQAAGAIAILIYNYGDTNAPNRNNPFTENVGVNITVPVFSLSYPLGSAFIEIDNLTISLYIHTNSYSIQTFNVIADTQTGDPNNIIVIGSHLDSVPAGPGINDNGSGSSTNLELAIQLYGLMNANSPLNIVNKVRFCWWGAEERGLVGSTFYVQSLNATQRSQIAMNINLDMVGSPNYYRAIYNGSSAADPNIRNGSTAIQYMFQEAFTDDLELSYDLSSFDGRSDYGPFIANGIPAGGLFTGAEKIKDLNGRAKYGGLANAPYDPCYHQYCDTVDNINQVVLIQNAKAVGYALGDFVLMKDLRNYLKNFAPTQ